MTGIDQSLDVDTTRVRVIRFVLAPAPVTGAGLGNTGRNWVDPITSADRFTLAMLTWSLCN